MSDFHSEKYDVIVLSAILEHIQNPVAILDSCRNMLKENGFLLISQASYDGFLPNSFPWIWYGWQPREHYWHFTPKSFSILADHQDFEPIFIERQTLYHPFVIKGGLKVLIGKNIAAFFSRIASALNLGDSFICILKVK